ncbi:MAG: cell division ATP-binding protein FtsE [Parcubacteria group bacterium CG23_combo_of_CG06-09_8_20_14_all_35_9]|nr:MAG: cell division ATP-binding protein FtsE [Parcubacteria group bacterium CG23_combo_of_CG06-09_8_20_14_all_35_9]
MIIFKNVSKIYPPDTHAVNNINLHIKPHEFVSIVGQSGSGKTTLVRLLIAEIKPTQGEIIVGGWNITGITPNEVPVLRRQIGVIFQDFKLLPRKTIFENVAFALEVCNTPIKKMKNIIPQVLKIVGLEGKVDRFPHQLSGGEAQRAVIARALVHRPKILIADEPSGNLDSINTREIIDLLLKINDFGTTIVLVTHNRDVVNGLHKRVISLDHGVIVSDREKGRYIL